MILDTNMLIEVMKNRVRLDEELKTLSPCVKELSRIKTKEAKLALQWIKKSGMEVVDSDLPADDAIVTYASRNMSAVATNDKELIKRLKKKNIKVFRLRQNRYLEEA